MKRLLFAFVLALMLCTACAGTNDNIAAEPTPTEEIVTTYDVPIEDITPVEDASEIEKALDKIVPQNVDATFSYVFDVTGKAMIEGEVYYFGTCGFVDSYNAETGEYTLCTLYTFAVNGDVTRLYETTVADNTVTWSDEANLA